MLLYGCIACGACKGFVCRCRALRLPERLAYGVCVCVCLCVCVCTRACACVRVCLCVCFQDHNPFNMGSRVTLGVLFDVLLFNPLNADDVYRRH